VSVAVLVVHRLLLKFTLHRILSWIPGSFRKATNSKVVFPTRSWLQIGSITTKCQRTGGVDHWSQGVDYALLLLH